MGRERPVGLVLLLVISIENVINRFGTLKNINLDFIFQTTTAKR